MGSLCAALLGHNLILSNFTTYVIAGGTRPAERFENVVKREGRINGLSFFLT